MVIVLVLGSELLHVSFRSDFSRVRFKAYHSYRMKLVTCLNIYVGIIANRGIRTCKMNTCKISRRKTEYLGCNEHQDAEIQLQGEPLKRVKTFTYLGSTLAEDGELDAEVTHRVQSGWKNWKRVSGVLCDRRMNMKIKGKVYRTVVRPALMYGAETWALKKTQEKKLEVAEMRMLRWMCGVTKMDKIRNERIRGTTKVGEITKKVQERRLKWYGHVMRREEHYVGRRAMVMKVQGRRKRGRPKRRWLDKVKDDIKEKGLSADDVYDRATWRRMSSYIDPT